MELYLPELNKGKSEIIIRKNSTFTKNQAIKIPRTYIPDLIRRREPFSYNMVEWIKSLCSKAMFCCSEKFVELRERRKMFLCA